MATFLCISLFLCVDSTPKQDDVIVFVGDSITQAGDYVAFVEAYLLASRPDEYFRVVNVGKSSETVSGTSEPDHHPPRPCIHDRFARDVAAFKPNVVVACYGMNDGNYFPFDLERFEKYKAGITRLVDRVFKETPARALVLLTPPSFDASRAPPPPLDGKSFGYKHPYERYDEVLRQYAQWLLTLKSERVSVVDVHREMLLERLRRSRGLPRAFSFSPDGVHPDERGHFLMALSILIQWESLWKQRKLRLDVQRPVASLSWDGASWFWKTPSIPGLFNGEMPISDRILEHQFNALTGYELKFKGLPNVPESAIIDLENHASVAGVDGKSEIRLRPYSGDRPRVNRTKLFTDLVRERRKRISSQWLAAQNDKPLTDLKLSENAVETAENATRDLELKIDQERQKEVSYEIEIQDVPKQKIKRPQRLR